MLLSVARTGVGPAARAEGAARSRAVGMQPDYLALMEADTMRPVAAPSGPARRVAAARLGTARLLDNVAVAP